LAAFLKQPEFLQKSYNKTGEARASEALCNSSIEIFRATFLTKLEKDFQADLDLAPHSSCLVENAKTHRLFELAMKQNIIQDTKKMSKRKRKKALKALENAMEKKIEIVITLCIADKIFGDLFDETYATAYAEVNSTNTTEEDLKYEYCSKKYMVDNNLFNPDYQVNLNPRNVNVSNLNCDEIVQNMITEAIDELKEEFEEESERVSKRKMKCVTKAIRSSRYYETLYNVLMLVEIEISDEEKAKERTKFIQNMKDMYERIIKC